MASVSERLKLLRLQRGFTQDEVANYLNIHRTTYTKYETTRAPDVDSLVKIARLYGMTLDELVGRTTVNKAASTQSAFHACSYYDELDLGTLSNDEKRMVLLLRSCRDVDKALFLVKKLILEDEFRDLYSEAEIDKRKNW